MTSIAFVCASNNAQILQHNLQASPCIAAAAHPLCVIPDAPSASRAYNAGLDRTDADIVVFTHHDVYLPLGWDDLLRQRIAEVAAIDPNWALIGAFGIGLDGAEYGPVWSSSLGFIAGRVTMRPQPVQSFDELLFVMRRDSGLRFDEGVMGFHMYGTDIVCQARNKGFGAYATSLPVIHNDGFKDALDDSFTQAFHAMRRKWPQFLPIRTPVIKIASHGLHLHRDRWRLKRARDIRQTMTQPVQTDPRDYAARCGWMDLRPCI